MTAANLGGECTSTCVEVLDTISVRACMYSTVTNPAAPRGTAHAMRRSEMTSALVWTPRVGSAPPEKRQKVNELSWNCEPTTVIIAPPVAEPPCVGTSASTRARSTMATRENVSTSSVPTPSLNDPPAITRQLSAASSDARTKVSACSHGTPAAVPHAPASPLRTSNGT